MNRSGTDTRHPIFARLYDRASRAMESGLEQHRARLLEGLAGRVVDVGAGNGMSFAHYPSSVTQVVAVEPEPYLRERAEAAARRAPVPVRVVAGVAGSLPLEDASMDAGVVSLVLCSVPDPSAALAELRRVVRAGGELRFFEHVRARSPVGARLQRALDATVWPLLAGGCHTARDTAGTIRDAGFSIEELDRFRFPDGLVPVPTATHVLGRARRPPGPAG